MPDNSLQNVMNTYIMPLALPILREACMMPALVNTDYDSAFAAQNQKVRVPLPQDLGPAQDFDPILGSMSTALSDPYIDITLDQWKYKQFQMNDKELAEVRTDAVLPSAAQSAIKSIANAVDMALLDLRNDIPFSVGTPGVLPTSTGEIVDARQVLNDNLGPTSGRYLLLNSGAEANYLKLVSQWINTGPVSTPALREAYLGRLHGFDIFVDQLIRGHQFGTAVTDTLTATIQAPAGSQALPISGSTGAKTLNRGDSFTIAGVLDSYGKPKPFVVTATVSAVNGTFGAVPIYPALPIDVAATSAIVFANNGIAGLTNESLAFSRDAFMLAMRPLANESSETSTISVATDPVTGIPLRLETWREPRVATRLWRFDILFGVKTLRPELAVRLRG